MAKSKGHSIRSPQSIDNEEDRTKNIDVIGLDNLGNTSCLNSVLQNLLYLRPFRDQLFYTMTRTEYVFVPKKHPYLETKTFSYSGKKAEPGTLTKELSKLMKETIYEKSSRKWYAPKIVTPRTMQDELTKKHAKFSDGSQQDSHEWFRSLINMLQEEEVNRLKEAFFDYFDINMHKTERHNYSRDEKKLKMKYASEFENSSLFTGTFIDETFGGKMLSTVKCEGCGNILDVNEDFLDISLPLPEFIQEHNILSSNPPQSELESNSEEEEVKRLNHMSNDYPKDSLEYYLMRFFSPIFLEDDYVCNNCNPQLVSNQDENGDTDGIDYDALIFTSAVKQFHIKSVGPVLTIHLKRFSQTGYGLQKLNKRFEYPLVLDMSPFCVSDTSVPKDCNNRILYGLRGIVKNCGWTVAGDYMAYVNIADWNVPADITNKDNETMGKRPNSHLYEHVTPAENWYYIRDSHISSGNHDEVFSSQAYILFYEKLPLVPSVPRNRIEEIGKYHKNNSESITCETGYAATKSQERPNPSLDQSFIIEKKHSNDCRDNRTKSMRVVGLQNLGNTCYLNSVLQNLLYLRPFRDQLIHTMNRTEYRLVPKKYPELETLTISYSKKDEPGKLTRGLFKLIIKTIYEKSSRKTVSSNIVMPWAVQNDIADKSGKFYVGIQQDSHELFRFLIDMVKEEEIQRMKTAFFYHFNTSSGEDSKNLLEYASKFDNISVFNGTFIDEAFGGKMTNGVECLNCGNMISLNEVFLDISLPLEGAVKQKSFLMQFLPKFLEDYFCNNCNPQLVSKQDASHMNVKSNGDKSKKVKRLNHMPNNYPKDSLEYYLMRFFSPIFLEEDYVCNNCNFQLVSNQDENDDTDSIDYDALKFTSAVKQFHIKSVGPVLTIHLKRFSQTGNGLRKLDKRVDFPLELDMSPFCVSDTSVPKDCNNKILYGLRGIVNHSGGMFGGHYVAYVNIAEWNKPSKTSNNDSAKSNILREINGEITSTGQPMDANSTQKNENDTVSLRSENSTSKPPIQPTPTPDSHLYEHVMPTEEWYYISDSCMSKSDHDRVFSSQAYILFYERLPLVPRDRVEEVGKECKNNSESVTCKTREAAANSLERPKPSLSQSFIIEKKQSDDCKANRIENMRIIGLDNLGNTCYFNSVLQNLLYLRPFRERLSYTMKRTKYKLVPKKHPELETIEFASDNKAEPGQLIQELFNLIQETVYQSDDIEGSHRKMKKKIALKAVKPKAVQNEIAKKHEKFSDGSQQDSHELFRFLIDMVKDEEIKRLEAAFWKSKHFNIKKDKTQSINCSVNRKILKKYGSEFDNLFVFTGTFIDDTFGGKMISTVKCECQEILDVNEDFMDISLYLLEDSRNDDYNQHASEIKSNFEKGVKVKSKGLKRLNNMPDDYNLEGSLEYYLMRFFSPTIMRNDYVCKDCNPQLVSKQDEASDANLYSGGDKNENEDNTDNIDYDALKFTSAVKQFHIKTVGPVLTIHLKRFSQTEYGLHKVYKRVKFPLVLDMSPFCVSDTSVLKDYDNKILYGLRGIVKHSGGLVAGHYVAYVNIADWNVPAKVRSKGKRAAGRSEERISTDELTDADSTQKNEDSRSSLTSEDGICEHVMPTEEWYYISDSFISSANRDEVFSSQAYILFYERLPLVAIENTVL